MVVSSSVSLASLVEQNLCEKFEVFKVWPKAKLEYTSEVVKTSNSIPFPVFNCVVKSNFDTTNAEKRIKSILRSYEELKVPCCWYVSPFSKPENLSSILEDNGLLLAENATGMCITDLNSKVFKRPASFYVCEVNTSILLREWICTFKSGFDLPDGICDAFYEFYNALGFSKNTPVRNFIGYLNDKPVCSGTLFLGRATAGIYNISTIPEARKLGNASYMTSHILDVIQKLGISNCVLITPTDKEEMYSKLGFEKACSFQYYIKLPEQ